MTNSGNGTVQFSDLSFLFSELVPTSAEAYLVLVREDGQDRVKLSLTQNANECSVEKVKFDQKGERVVFSVSLSAAVLEDTVKFLIDSGCLAVENNIDSDLLDGVSLFLKVSHPKADRELFLCNPLVSNDHRLAAHISSLEKLIGKSARSWKRFGRRV